MLLAISSFLALYLKHETYRNGKRVKVNVKEIAVKNCQRAHKIKLFPSKMKMKWEQMTIATRRKTFFVVPNMFV
jgi:hypothetical protein